MFVNGFLHFFFIERYGVREKTKQRLDREAIDFSDEKSEKEKRFRDFGLSVTNRQDRAAKNHNLWPSLQIIQITAYSISTKMIFMQLLHQRKLPFIGVYTQVI